MLDEVRWYFLNGWCVSFVADSYIEQEDEEGSLANKFPHHVLGIGHCNYGALRCKDGNFYPKLET